MVYIRLDAKVIPFREDECEEKYVRFDTTEAVFYKVSARMYGRR